MRNNKVIDSKALDARKIRTLAFLTKSIDKLNQVNVYGEFNGELEFLNLIKNKIKDSITTGQGKLIAAIIC